MTLKQKVALTELVAEAAAFGESGESWQAAESAVKAAIKGEGWTGQAKGVYDLALVYLETIKPEAK